MANPEHLQILGQRVEAWNAWRNQHRDIIPDLREAGLYRADLSETDLREANLTRANLREANLTKANLLDGDLTKADLREARLSHASLRGADLWEADLTKADLWEADLSDASLWGAHLREADLTKANLSRANLWRANLTKADLWGANLTKADLREADLREANLYKANLMDGDLTKADLREARLWAASLLGAHLREADLREADLWGAELATADLSRADLSDANLALANLVETNFAEANLTGCQVYGISAWNVKLEGTTQLNLVITPAGEPVITVDNLEVAQFIYLLLRNEKIREVIDTITSKTVLILGRFTPERKTVLDALRNELRRQDYLPILFDFEPSFSRNLTETVSTLAHMARFVIADITDAKSIPQELQRIIPNLPSLPIQPLILSSQYEYAMFKDFRDYPWVLPPYRYDSLEMLLAVLNEKVIFPAEARATEVEERRKAFEEDISTRGSRTSNP